MASVEANGITIEYECVGEDAAPAVLLIMGAGEQLTHWPQEFCDGLATSGFRVIRYDNRDTGLSTRFDDAGAVDIPALMEALRQGEEPEIPYGLNDMAADATALLDALDIDAAHVIAMSMGGMIAQLLGIRHAGKVKSLTLMMTGSSDHNAPGPNPGTMQRLMRPPADIRSREARIENRIAILKLLENPGYPEDEALLRQKAEKWFDRGFNPAGMTRHSAAIITAPGRAEALASMNIPTLVIHGTDDPLLPVAGGEALANCIPGATFMAIDGMGHNVSAAISPVWIDAIVPHMKGAAANQE